MVPPFAAMLEQDRKRRGFTVGQVAWRLGISAGEYRELEAGTGLPSFQIWDAICKLADGRRPSSEVKIGNRSPNRRRVLVPRR